jgi:hypothetical protein
MMLQSPLAFDFSKTRMICDAFDGAWAFLLGVGSDLTEPSKSLAARTILAKRIIEMADQNLMDVTELRADALAFLQHNPPRSQKGSERTIGVSAISLAEQSAKRLIQRRVRFQAADGTPWP